MQETSTWMKWVMPSEIELKVLNANKVNEDKRSLTCEKQSGTKQKLSSRFHITFGQQIFVPGAYCVFVFYLRTIPRPFPPPGLFFPQASTVKDCWRQGRRGTPQGWGHQFFVLQTRLHDPNMTGKTAFCPLEFFWHIPLLPFSFVLLKWCCSGSRLYLRGEGCYCICPYLLGLLHTWSMTGEYSHAWNN